MLILYSKQLIKEVNFNKETKLMNIMIDILHITFICVHRIMHASTCAALNMISCIHTQFHNVTKIIFLKTVPYPITGFFHFIF